MPDPTPLPDTSSEITFGHFIVSLATSAFMNMGDMQPEGETPSVDLALAQQSIELIDMLRDKTRGNLNKEEQELIDGLLYDLRSRYIEVSKR